jgi:bifunctional enzyme CysN/CysC
VQVLGRSREVQLVEHVQWHSLEVPREQRAALKRQAPACVWFTGLPGAGKSSLASRLERRLAGAGCHTYLLDGDNLRHGLNRDLRFTAADREENVRRAAEVAALMMDAGLIVLVALISPLRSHRQLARRVCAGGLFLEVFVDTPLEECERRDPKGMYAKARAGTLAHFTGVDGGYEPPLAPDLRLLTHGRSVDDCVEEISVRLSRTDRP